MTTLDQKIAEFFNGLSANGWNYGNLILVVIAVLLTIILSGIVGLEREARGRSAGLRTHLLVGLSSCIIMIISIYGFPASAGTRDVARLAAQVITGVGFLGAGAIIHAKGGIKGLTTASTIWIVMAIGLACGSMNFILAIVSTVCVMLVLIVFKRVEGKITKNKPIIAVIAKADVPVMTMVLNIAAEMNLHVFDVSSEILKDGKANEIEVIFKVANSGNSEFDVDLFIKEVQERTDALSVHIINHH